MFPQTPIKGKEIFLIMWIVVIAFCTLSFLFLDIPIAMALKGQKAHLWNVALYKLTTYGLAQYYLIPAALIAIILFLVGLKSSEGLREKLNNWCWKISFLFIAVATTGIVTNILKIIFGRSRPRMLFYTGEYGFQGFNFDVDHWSFPSGHVTNVISFITALFIITPPKKRIYLAPLFIMAFLIIISRVTVQAHFLSDIVFSSYWGATATVILFYFYSRLLRSTRNDGSKC